MRINVTQRDIDKGVKTKPEACPVGLAVGRRFTGVPRPLVGPTTVVAYYRKDPPVLLGHGRYATYSRDIPLPRKVQDWIIEFDTGGIMRPFTFTLDA